MPFSLTWKIGTYAFGVSTLALAVAVFLLKLDNQSLAEDLIQANKDLVTAHNNAASLEAVVSEQNRANELLAAESKRKMQKLAKELVEAQKRTLDAEKRVAVLLSRPIQGSTLEARVLHVDAIVLETVR